MDSFGDLLIRLIEDYWGILVLITFILLISIFLSEVRRIVDWLIATGAVIKFLEVAMVVFLIVATYHCFLEHFRGANNEKLWINPLSMVIILVISTLLSIIVYVAAIYIISVIRLKLRGR